MIRSALLDVSHKRARRVRRWGGAAPSPTTVTENDGTHDPRTCVTVCVSIVERKTAGRDCAALLFSDDGALHVFRAGIPTGTYLPRSFSPASVPTNVLPSVWPTAGESGSQSLVVHLPGNRSGAPSTFWQMFLGVPGENVRPWPTAPGTGSA